MIASSGRSLRSFAFALLSLVMGFALVAPAVAQDATPEASPEAAVAFDGLELTRFEVTVNEGTVVPRVPGDMGEGWFILDVNNTTEAAASVNLAQLPEGTAFGDLTSVLAKSFKGEGGELPEWWATTKFAGGTTVAPGATVSIMVYLTPGNWTVFSTNPGAAQSPANFHVQTPEELEANTGVAAEATPAASPEAAGPALPEGVTATTTATISDSAVAIDPIPASGNQIVQITNGGSAVSDLVVVHSPDTLDEAGAYALIKNYMTTGDLGSAHMIGGAGTLSPGASQVVSLDLMPGGTTIVFSTNPAADGSLQVDGGVWVIFTAN